MAGNAKPTPAQATRVAGSRYLRVNPRSFVWRDSTASPVRRIRSLAWFLTGGWRAEVIRFIGRLVLSSVGARQAVDTPADKKQTGRSE